MEGREKEGRRNPTSKEREWEREGNVKEGRKRGGKGKEETPKSWLTPNVPNGDPEKYSGPASNNYVLESAWSWQ